MRRNTALVTRDGYTPNHMLDVLMARLNVKSDAALARALAVPPSTISKIRHKQMPVNSSLLLAAHDATEMSIRDLRHLLGDTATRYWLGDSNKHDEVMQMTAYVERLHKDGVQSALLCKAA